MRFWLALATALLPATAARAQDSWWSASAPQREARRVEHSCIGAEPAGAISIAQHLEAGNRVTEALHCLEVSSKYHPLDKRAARARAALLTRLGRQAEAAAILARIGPPDAAESAESAKSKAVGKAKVAAKPAEGRAPAPTSGAGEGEPGKGEAAAEGEHGKDDRAAASPAAGEGEPAAGGPAKGEPGDGGPEKGEPGEGGHGEGDHEKGEHGEGGKEEGGSRLLAGYSHSKAGGVTLTDGRLGASLRFGEYTGNLGLHLLTAKGGDDKGGKVLDTALLRSWSAGRTGLLLGAALGKTDVTYKSMFGLRHELPLGAETVLGIDLRRVKYPDGVDTGLGLDGRTVLAEHWLVGGRFDFAKGAVKGSAVTVRSGYETAGLEAQAFVVSGHGIAPHPYLAPEDTDAFRTIGLDLDKDLVGALSLGFGVERRTEGKVSELEVSIGLAWEF